MELVFDGSDYTFTVSKAELTEATTATKTLGGFSYEPLNVPTGRLRDDDKPEMAGLWASNDGSYFRSRDPRIHFEVDEAGPVFRVHTAELLDLLNGRIPSLMTRYDNTNKVLIQLQSEDPSV